LEGKAKAQIAVTHLALLGVKRQEPAFWGYERRAARLAALLLALRSAAQDVKG